MENAAAHHDMWDLLGDILLILALAGMVIPALQRLKISPVLGYLLCGLLIGPYGLGLFIKVLPWISAFVITDLNLMKTLAELGVIFLLFMIGLELTFSRLWDLRKFVLGLGSVQIILTGIVIFAIAYQFDNSLPTAILLSAAFALSSTAVVMQLLNERHLISKPIGQICFSVLLMQDLAVVPILVLIGTFSGQAGGSVLYALLEALFMAACVVAVIIAAGKLLLRPLLRILSPSNSVEWLFAAVLFLVIGASYITHGFGLSAALGAFLAGLLIAETEYRHEIEIIIEPVKGLLLGIFFLSVGMVTDLSIIAQHPIWLPASVIGIFLIKALLFFPIALAFSIPKRQAAQASVLLAQCGEFAFIVIGLALTSKLMPEKHAQFFLLVTSFSLLITPLITRLAPLAEWLVSFASDKKISAENGNGVNEDDHIIIAGFGRVGQTMANILEDQKIRYVAIDTDGVAVSKFRAEGYPVLFGNARKMKLWHRLNIDSAAAAVITIDDFSVTEAIVRSLRHEWPLIPIIVRVHDTSHMEQYYQAGATIVVPETLESTLQLMKTLLEQIGIEKEEANNITNKYRQEVFSREGSPS